MAKWSTRTISMTLALLAVLTITYHYLHPSIVAPTGATRQVVDPAEATGSSTGPQQATAPAKAALAAVLATPGAPETVRRPPLTVVCVSDTHGLHLEPGLIKVPQGDLLLFPGDVEVGSAAEGAAFSRWLEGLPVRGPKVLTWGNMDTGTPGQSADLVPAAIVVVDSMVEVNGYRIFASPWTPRFAGAYQLDDGDDALFARWSALLPPDADVDIILTHGPPFGIADEARGQHRGDRGLLRAVQALKKPPLLWVCGHIHEQYGLHQVPHAAAPGGSFLLLNSAVYYARKPQHAATAQPRAVRLPEVEVLPLA